VVVVVVVGKTRWFQLPTAVAADPEKLPATTTHNRFLLLFFNRLDVQSGLLCKS
jgi:hypothetical protein